MEDIFGEKDLIEQTLLVEEGKYHFSDSPGFWEETDPRSSIFFLGGEYVGVVYLTKDGRWRAHAHIPASLRIGKGSAKQVQPLIYSRKKVEAKKAVEDFYRRLLE